MWPVTIQWPYKVNPKDLLCMWMFVRFKHWNTFHGFPCLPGLCWPGLGWQEVPVLASSCHARPLSQNFNGLERCRNQPANMPKACPWLSPLRLGKGINIISICIYIYICVCVCFIYILKSYIDLIQQFQIQNNNTKICELRKKLLVWWICHQQIRWPPIGSQGFVCSGH